MSNTFFDKSKDIANEYIQSIVFLDDRAYKNTDGEDTNHDFDVSAITKVFAKENKICAAYKPESEEDIESFILIADKSDIVVLDWQIQFTKPIVSGSEEEDEPDDPRGYYTKKVIESILFDKREPKNSLKLIIVYTGDFTGLKDISDDIYTNVFKSSTDFNFNIENHCIESPQIKVLIRAKHVPIGFEHNKDIYEKNMVSYEDLPAFVINEFALMTSGLLSNFLLLSLITLRQNSSKILGVFSKDLDPAFLGHKAIIPKQEDAEDLLVELFGDTVKDLLYYEEINRKIRENLINHWVDDNIVEEDFKYSKKIFKKTKTILKNFLFTNEEDIKTRFNTLLKGVDGQVKNYLQANPTKLYTNNTEIDKTLEKDKSFAKLTHHKSLFIPRNISPRLSLGTLIKSTTEEIYYICIQQKCDSVRIPKDAERKFLFIPLKRASSNKFDLITDNGIELKKDNSSYSIRTIKFICTNDMGVILAEEEHGKFIFKQKYSDTDDEQFEWVLDLKDLHSQRIVTDYASKLSRVGLNESEWHRRFLS